MMRAEHEIALKQALGANDVRHSGRTLFDHLKGTYELLASWDAPEDVQLAGLFHSVYGTRVFKYQCLRPTNANRALIRNLIGERAERLAYIFCISDRPNFQADGLDLEDLLLIERANLQEQSSQQRVVRPR
jgi:hypothetical protein